MADAPLPDAEDSAEKAYAAATETSSAAFPPKPKRGGKPARSDSLAKPAPAEKAAIGKPLKPEPAKATSTPPFVDEVPALPAFKAKAPKALPPQAAAPEPIATPAVAETTSEPPITPEAPVAAAPALETPAPLPMPDTAPATPPIAQLKDTTMNAQTDFTNSTPAGGLKDIISDVKAKAKAAFDKGTSSLGDAADFAKGNVEAVVESGKIYAAGLQELGSNYVAESKAAIETMTADVKELAAQKTPVDFFKLQGELTKKNFESAVAFGSKSSEAWLKLATDAFAPLSGRVNLAVEKIKAAA